MKFTFRDIVWIGIIALIIVVLSKCHKNKADNLNKSVDELLNGRKKADSIYAIQVRDLENSLLNLTEKMQTVTTLKQTAEAALDKSMSVVKRLSTQVNLTKDWPIDPTALTVPHEYVDYCDSLAWTADSLTVNYALYKLTNTSLLKTKDSVIYLQTDLLSKERSALERCKSEFNALHHYYKLADSRAKPVNQMFIGAELIGSEKLLIQNVGVALTLKTKTNKLWQLSGGLQNNGGIYGRINGNILIRLRKN